MLPLLVQELERQAHGLPVEILYLGDNRRVSTGYKCQVLLEMASGAHITYVADDDWVERDYVKALLPYANGTQMHTSFAIQCWEVIDEQLATRYQNFGANQWGWKEHSVISSAGMPTGMWLTGFARSAKFPNINLQEDVAWTGQLMPELNKNSHLYNHIDRVLYHYKSSKYISEHRRDWEYGKPDEYVWNDDWSKVQ